MKTNLNLFDDVDSVIVKTEMIKTGKDAIHLMESVLNETDITYIVVFVAVICWILGMVYLVNRLLRHFTFGNWGTGDKPQQNPYQYETLGIPRGTFRGLLTVSLLFMVMLFEVVNLIVPGLEDSIESLLTAFQMMLAFYFGSKVLHHVTKSEERKSLGNPGQSPPTLTPPQHHQSENVQG